MKNSAREFLDAISENTELREYLETYQIPEGMEKEDCLVAVAEKFGYTVTKEELAEAFRCKQEELKVSASGAEETVQEIPVDELDSVAGGGGVGVANQGLKKQEKENDDCQFTFIDEENCWTTDGCDNVILSYVFYHCHLSTKH